MANKYSYAGMPVWLIDATARSRLLQEVYNVIGTIPGASMDSMIHAAMAEVLAGTAGGGVSTRFAPLTNSGNSQTLNAADADWFQFTATDNCDFSFVMADGDVITLDWYTGVGGFGYTFTGVVWGSSTAPTATALAGKLDQLVFAKSGGVIRGSVRDQNFPG
jgi:hypothetical protein